jgi:glucose-specific phosphotransferase system IIA component
MLFSKKNKIFSPADGTYIPISDVNDPVFAQGVVGDGVAVVPAGNEIISPVSGVITMIADQKHGIGITMEDGTEVLIHMGIDTVELGGRPFTIYKKVNDKVVQGETIALMDINAIELAGKETVVLVIAVGKKQLKKKYDVLTKVKCNDELAKIN